MTVATAVRRTCLYTGTVVHKRLSPKKHAFAYRVFCLHLDLDEINEVARNCRLFSRNRLNVLSFHDRDHGRGDGSDVAASVRELLRDADLTECGVRVSLLCYPRVFGYVFNPLSVYFCHTADGRLGAIVYEVTNTFHERRSYVLPVPADAGEVVTQRCGKAMYVSPFTGPSGDYGFHVRQPGDEVLVGVDLRIGDGTERLAVLKTHFRGERRLLSDMSILASVLRHPLMTIKVIAAIHFEAARLWSKGVAIVKRQPPLPTAVTVGASTLKDTPHGH